MVGEEIGINDHLAANGIEPIETDLGEYIIQLRGEAPSHIIAPSVHVTKDQVEETFRRVHTDLDPNRNLSEPSSLLHEARVKLRGRFIAADVGITGANFLIANSGTTTIVTNEGNGDLTQTLPRIHIVLAGIEKIVPSIEDAGLLLRVLARSATGQEMSAYTTFSTGPRRPDDVDGPDAFHVVLVDNGRSKLLGTEFEEMLRCIRCGACLNHCPIYHNVGGHAYGWVYAGPIGAITTPALIGIEHAAPLPEASSLCGRCESGLPGAHPDPEDAACLARGSVRAPPARQPRALGAEAVGGAGDAAGAVSAGDARRRGRARRARRQARHASPRCRSPAAGPRIATCRRRRGAPSWRCTGEEVSTCHPIPSPVIPGEAARRVRSRCSRQWAVRRSLRALIVRRACSATLLRLGPHPARKGKRRAVETAR